MSSNHKIILTFNIERNPLSLGVFNFQPSTCKSNLHQQILFGFEFLLTTKIRFWNFHSKIPVYNL